MQTREKRKKPRQNDFRAETKLNSCRETSNDCKDQQNTTGRKEKSITNTKRQKTITEIPTDD